jgi:hypothetical protein
LLISLFPFRFWQDLLIRTHVQKCEACMSQVASRDEVKTLIIQEDDVKDFRDLWPAVKTGVAAKKPDKKALFSLNRQWLFVATGLVALFLAGFLFYSLLFQNGILSEQEGKARFQINSIRVGDESATPFLYQPKDSDMILIWAEKSL